MTIIDFLNILHNKSKTWNDLSEQERKEFQPFMISRWLSMDSNYCEIVNELQQYTIGVLDKRSVFMLFQDLLPYQKKYFVKYYKGAKEDKYNPELISLFKNHLQESKKNTIELLHLIYINNNTNILTELLKMYGKSDREIKTLLKIK